MSYQSKVTYFLLQLNITKTKAMTINASNSKAFTIIEGILEIRSLLALKRTKLSILNSCIKSALPYGCVPWKEVFNDRRNLLVKDTTHFILQKILNFEIKS